MTKKEKEAKAKAAEKAAKIEKRVPTPLETLTETMAKALVKKPENIKAKQLGTKDITIELSGIDKDDYGRIFGSKGKNSKAMYTLIKSSVAAQTEKRGAFLRKFDILDVPEKKTEKTTK